MDIGRQRNSRAPPLPVVRPGIDRCHVRPGAQLVGPEDRLACHGAAGIIPSAHLVFPGSEEQHAPSPRLAPHGVLPPEGLDRESHARLDPVRGRRPGGALDQCFRLMGHGRAVSVVIGAGDSGRAFAESSTCDSQRRGRPSRLAAISLDGIFPYRHAGKVVLTPIHSGRCLTG